MMRKAITNQFFKSLDKVRYGNLKLITPEGKEYHFEGENSGLSADIILHDWSVVGRLIKDGDIAFAKDYSNGKFDTSNLTNLLIFGLQNEEVLRHYIHSNFVPKLLSRIKYLFQINTLKQSKRNIYQHYDLGNDFYKLWLDDSMTYSSALFHSETESLREAQNNKYDRILERLGDAKDILEIGCGWGGFIDRALERGDYNIKGITISDAQSAYAKERVKGAADIAVEDYRLQSGRYDGIVSIEMFEAVGSKYWPIYFAKVKKLLKNGGKAIIQTIVIKDEFFSDYKKSSDMLRSYIFPGGLLPSERVFHQKAMAAGLRVNDSYRFGFDYAKTLELWLERFDQKYQQVKALGFDDEFIRLWRFYLSSCIASFKTGRTDVIQIALEG